MNDYNKFAAMISSEFQRYLMENEQSSDLLTRNSLVVFQVEGEEDFNLWHKNLSLKNREAGQTITYVHLKKWRLHSVIEDMTFVEAAV
jgi:hypothetical protein